MPGVWRRRNISNDFRMPDSEADPSTHTLKSLLVVRVLGSFVEPVELGKPPSFHKGDSAGTGLFKSL